MSGLRLGDVDRDGALADGLAALGGATRAGFLRSALIGGGALLAAVAAPREAVAQTAARDVDILNFALGLEELQAAFYSGVERNKVLHGPLADQARIVGAHERAHVEALRAVLGRRARGRPHFDFGAGIESPAAFRRTAVAFEDLAVAAYKGQAPHLHSRELLASALAIHSVEARHAAWIRRLAGQAPAASAFDNSRSRGSTTRIVAATHFVVDTNAKGSPSFTG
jgi:hypothetical protein